MLPTSPFQFLRYESESPDSSWQPITLWTTTSWSHAGAVLNPASLPAGYHAWANATVKSGNLLTLLTPFLNFLHKWLAETHMTHYLLTIRAQKSTSEFDRPRWHVDRRFFENPSLALSSSSVSGSDSESEKVRNGRRRVASVWKVATALIGPGTLFLKDSKRGLELQRRIERELKMKQKKKGHYAVDEKHVCRTFRCLGCAEMADAVRVKLAEAVEKEGLEVVQMGAGEVSIFRADGEDGGGEYREGSGVGAAMHSEPPMGEGDRVFVHVVPGTEDEVRRLVEGWGMEFPRDWSVGVLVNWGADIVS
jgi:hypothetical protein